MKYFKKLMFFSVLFVTLFTLVFSGCSTGRDTGGSQAADSRATGGQAATPTKSNTDFAKAQNPVKADECYECHDTIKSFHSTGTHKEVNCISCHNALPEHIADASTRPATDFSWDACGTCHVDQMKSISSMAYHRPARDDKSQPTNRSPIWFEKLMMPHGFTKEHAITRPHAVMLLDQYVVDRAFGGRFQPKNGWEYVLETGKVWDILEDTHPEEKGQKVFLPQTAMAANPVCISCKTADLMLDWPYLGEPGKGAPYDRTSNVVEMAKNTNYSINCVFCHDPHSAKPRIIRDALIDALERPGTMYQRDANRTGITVYTMGERGYDRKIAILDKPDSRLMCAQCHVEYNCNAGVDTETGAPIGFSSPLTNYFPLVDAMEMYEHYIVGEKFADFKNKFSGAFMLKMQHPEFETYYESAHSKLGVGCSDCHMAPPAKKRGATSHFVESPRYIMKETCLTDKCHSKWTEEQGIYAINSVKAYTKGRMRKAEFWLSTLIDKIQEGRIVGISSEVLQNARTSHSEAHVLWEYWTAENSDGFHNPELARASLTKSITISQNAIDAIDKAINDKLAK
ncbi:MAG: ammonia-forming cytochrome c nitrite reductase subunit c552 [Deferribacteraceae bacterium]|jgi:formate-dependent nitrite reductase cytochrome c552 subunit|nr:ammonia-forming cytochrome c nitrite reductase subunit c552 [Deferribacteraceae bacterium]